MKKIEIEQIISELMSEQPIRIIDLMNKSYSINSYEKFIEEFSLIKNSFKGHINEFVEIANNYLNNMKNLIDDCDKTDKEAATDYIKNNFYSKLGIDRYSRETTLSLLFIESLENDNSDYINTIIQVYEELGYENLLYYIELLKNPNSFSSYLNDSKKQQVAMHYILYKTNHHSSTRLKRNANSLSLYKTMESNINESINNIVQEKDDYINFMNNEKDNYISFINEEKEKFDTWFSSSDKNYKDFLSKSKKELRNLEKTYSEKLKIEEPSKFMKDKAEEYKKKTKKWAIVIIAISILLLLLLGFILSPKIELNKKIITVNLFSNKMPIYSSIIILSMICLIIYVIRIFIKIMMSSKHLSEEYHQKYVLTYFYLSLINSGNMDKKLGNVILSLLFTKADTGLIKNDTSNEYESLIKTLIHPDK